MLLILFLLTVLRIWISYNTPVILYTDQTHDDVCLMRMTANLLQGNWLGSYDQYTLMKGITYSLFCSFCGITRIPYTILLSVLNVASAYVLVRSLRFILTCIYVQYVLYIFLIYSPITFAAWLSQRIYRNALTVPLVLLVIAGIFGLYFNIGRRSGIKYAVLAGVSLFFFWNLREDSIWIVPFLAVSVVIIFVFLCLSFLKDKNRKGFIKKLRFWYCHLF